MYRKMFQGKFKFLSLTVPLLALYGLVLASLKELSKLFNFRVIIALDDTCAN